MPVASFIAAGCLCNSAGQCFIHLRTIMTPINDKTDNAEQGLMPDTAGRPSPVARTGIIH